MIAGQSILTQKVVVMRHKEKTSRTSVDLGISCVTTEPTLALALANLAESGETTQLFGNTDLHVVIEQDEWGLFGLSLLAARHSSTAVRC